MGPAIAQTGLGRDNTTSFVQRFQGDGGTGVHATHAQIVRFPTALSDNPGNADIHLPPRDFFTCRVLLWKTQASAQTSLVSTYHAVAIIILLYSAKTNCSNWIYDY